jgi:flavin-dependent dehydrogenase
MTPAQAIYDIVIVGAGPAGTATAIHLARAGWRIVVVDRAAFPRDKPCAEYLSPAAEPLLRELGVLDALLAAGAVRLRGFQIYAPDGRRFQGDFVGCRDAFGRVLFDTGLSIPRLLLDSTLVEQARRSGVEVRERWSLASLHRDLGTGLTRLEPSGQTADAILARLVIAADGVHSTVAQRLGLHTPGRLRKIALVAHLRGLAGAGAYGEMHVAGRCYVGLARLEDAARGDLCNVALVVDAKRDGRLVAGRADAFLFERLRTFPALAGRLQHAHIARRTLTASGLHVRARRLSTDGVLLVGDAAGYYDPFTGEGIYRALASARLAADVATEALAADDLSVTRLARYDRRYREAVHGRHLVEAAIQLGVNVPCLMTHVGSRLARRPALANTLIGVTGDYLPPRAVLRPGYVLGLLL